MARNDEYVSLSAAVNVPMFVKRDHQALTEAAELGPKATLARPNTIDIPGLVAAIEETTARPTGMMVVGWEPSALIPAINGPGPRKGHPRFQEQDFRLTDVSGKIVQNLLA